MTATRPVARRLPLANLCDAPDDIRCGPFGTQLGKSEFTDRGVPLWGIRHVNAKFERPTHEFLTPGKAKRLANYSLEHGDIVMTRKGTVGNCAVYPPHFPDGIMHSDLLRIRVARSECLPEFLAYQLQYSADVARQVGVISGGAIMPGINVGRLKRIEVVLPPLAEQRRIAAILARADALRTQRRIAGARLGTLTNNIFLEMFGDPFRKPGRWRETTLGAHATFTGGGTPSRARPEYFAGSVCWATSKDMKGEFLDDTEEHITGEAIAQSATKLVPAGTILVVVKSKVLMHRLPVAISRVPTCFGQDLKGISPDSEYWTVPFVATATRLGQRWLLERARGANTEGLTLEHLRAFPMILPPVPLQNEFDARARAVAALGTVADRSLMQLDTLCASLQQRAFRGEL